ncbi:MAG: M48 family metallopeptidase [Armatimonadetes bacterium]|nr:M48 family metallopeptidase [Armatimonadota bacterium]MDW8121115.1 M48 family metallopeptidase [Armatimonadota bacterium]
MKAVSKGNGFAALVTVILVLIVIGQATASDWSSFCYEDWHLTAIAKRLTEVSGASVSFKSVLILPIQEANAFVSEDGSIIVTEGLLEQLDDSDQMAFVLAHELVHFLKGHPRDRESNPTRLDRIRTELERGIGGTIVGTALEWIFKALSSYYSREREREADEEAVRLMALAGFRPTAALTCLKRLEKQSGFLSWFRSHPFVNERLNIVAAQVRKWMTKTTPLADLKRPQTIPTEIFLSLQWHCDPSVPKELSSFWSRSFSQADRLLWSALQDQTSKINAPFVFVRPWQRYRAQLVSLRFVLHQAQSFPLPSLTGWHQWVFKMEWILSDPRSETVLTASQEKLVLSTREGEDLVQALSSHIRSLTVPRLAKFIVQSLLESRPPFLSENNNPDDRRAVFCNPSIQRHYPLHLAGWKEKE